MRFESFAYHVSDVLVLMWIDRKDRLAGNGDDGALQLSQVALVGATGRDSNGLGQAGFQNLQMYNESVSNPKPAIRT